MRRAAGAKNDAAASQVTISSSTLRLCAAKRSHTCATASNTAAMRSLWARASAVRGSRMGGMLADDPAYAHGARTREPPPSDRARKLSESGFATSSRRPASRGPPWPARGSGLLLLLLHYPPLCSATGRTQRGG